MNDCSLEMAALNRELRQWEKTYNTVRPHQSLGYLTPCNFFSGGIPNERSECVTHLLDEFTNLICARTSSRLQSGFSSLVY